MQYEIAMAIQPCMEPSRRLLSLMKRNVRPRGCCHGEPLSRLALGSAGQRRYTLRPTFQRGTSGIVKSIDAALSAIEPAVDVVEEDFRRVGDVRLEVADATRAAR